MGDHRPESNPKKTLSINCNPESSVTMSSFALRRAVFLPRTAYATRAFTTSFAAQKSATEAVKDGAKKVDRTVSDNVVLPGLDAAESAKEKLKGSEAKAEGTAEKMKGQAKGAAAEAEGKAKGAAENI